MWHVEFNGKPGGPYTDEQLKALCEAKAVNAATLVWRPEFTNWRPLRETDFIYRDAVSPPPLNAETAPGAHPYQPPVPVARTGENLSLWRYFTRCLTSKYAEFHGRARRKEFWSYQLFATLFFLAAILVGAAIDLMLGNFGEGLNNPKPIASGILIVLAYLALFIPGLCVRIRRLHDLDMSGWLYLIVCFPYLGALALFVISLIPTQMYNNKHGLPPL